MSEQGQQEQLNMIVKAVIYGAKKGKMPFFTEEGINKFSEMVKNGITVDFKSFKTNENVG
jgi:hypothetical protein